MNYKVGDLVSSRNVPNEVFTVTDVRENRLYVRQGGLRTYIEMHNVQDIPINKDLLVKLGFNAVSSGYLLEKGAGRLLINKNLKLKHGANYVTQLTSINQVLALAEIATGEVLTYEYDF